MGPNVVDHIVSNQMVVRCGHIQPDHSSCGRRLAVWMLERSQLREKKPPGDDVDRVRGQRVSYSCHPKRGRAKYDLRLAVITSRILEGMEGGRTELWLGDRTESWFA